MEDMVMIIADAEEDLHAFIQYLLFEKKNDQAASALLNDFEITKQALAMTAGSMKLCENPKLKEYGYRRMNFRTHRYFLLYRIVDELAIVDNFFHELQDFENKLQ